jgi:hypothetical protein
VDKPAIVTKPKARATLPSAVATCLSTRHTQRERKICAFLGHIFTSEYTFVSIRKIERRANNERERKNESERARRGKSYHYFFVLCAVVFCVSKKVTMMMMISSAKSSLAAFSCVCMVGGVNKI